MLGGALSSTLLTSVLKGSVKEPWKRDPYNIKCHIPVTSKVSEGLVTWYAVYYSSSHLLLIIRYVFSIYSIMSDLYLTTTSL